MISGAWRLDHFLNLQSLSIRKAWRNLARRRRNVLATILDPAIGAGAFQLDLQLQHEISRLFFGVEDVGRAGRFFRTGFTDNGAIGNMPNLRISIPSIQRLAIEDLHPARMVFEIDRPRLISAQKGCHVRRALALAGSRSPLLCQYRQYFKKPEGSDDKRQD